MWIWSKISEEALKQLVDEDLKHSESVNANQKKGWTNKKCKFVQCPQPAVIFDQLKNRSGLRANHVAHFITLIHIQSHVNTCDIILELQVTTDTPRKAKPSGVCKGGSEHLFPCGTVWEKSLLWLQNQGSHNKPKTKSLSFCSLSENIKQPPKSSLAVIPADQLITVTADGSADNL